MVRLGVLRNDAELGVVERSSLPLLTEMAVAVYSFSDVDIR